MKKNILQLLSLVTALLCYCCTFLDESIFSLPSEIYYGWILFLFVCAPALFGSIKFKLPFVFLLIWIPVNILLSTIPEVVSPWQRSGIYLVVIFLLWGGYGQKLKFFRQSLLDSMAKSGIAFVTISFIIHCTGVNYKIPFQGIFGQSMLLGPVAGLCCLYSMKHCLCLPKRSRLFMGASATICFLSCLLSGSRCAAGATVAGIGVFLYFSKWRKLFLAGCVVLLTAVILIGVQTDLLSNKYTETLIQKHENNIDMGGVTASREELWELLKGAVIKHPIKGIGFGNMPGVEYGESGTIEPGSSWFYLLASLGLIGFMIYGWLWLSTGVKICLRKEKTPHEVMLLAMMTLCVLHMIFEGYILAAGSGLLFFTSLILGVANDHVLSYRSFDMATPRNIPESQCPTEATVKDSTIC